MLPADVLRQVRRLHIRTRRAVQTLFGGEYHSAFKGSGLSFDEVREYQPGDDVRQIDWNVTARTGTAFIKRYIEERELTILLAMDVSGSLRFGTQAQTKRTVAAELAALVSFCAVSNHDRIGLLCFTNEVEKTVPPNKGTRHVLRVLRDILYYEPKQSGTDLRIALDHLNKVQKRRAIVFLFSDFHEVPAEALRRTAQQHDVICVRISDQRELELPAVGLLQTIDPETGARVLLDTDDARFRRDYAAAAAHRQATNMAKLRQSGADVLDARTDGLHFEEMLRFFRRRERRRA
jgi:uncharacterized protein (DUF58 family)